MARKAASPATENALGYELPDFEARDPSSPPTSHFVLDRATASLREEPGRRPSTMLCVNRLRQQVDEWRADRYGGASDTTKRLFRWWFEEGSAADPEAFKPYWGQREAIETLAYLVEIGRVTDVQDLIEEYAQIADDRGRLSLGALSFQTTMEDVRQLLVPDRTVPFDLPPEGLARFACKAATGSGKTLVMALTVVWSYFHARKEHDSPLAANFLVVAPNVIVFDRLRIDFEDGKVFREHALIPPGWAFDLRVILRGEGTEPSGTGNLFLTNVQQLYAADAEWTPQNAIDRLLGPKPSGSATQSRSILERIRSVGRLVALNDEAHHVHDDDLKWNQTLLDLADRPDGLALWLDFSATPKYQTGAYFPWVVSDYPLAQAVEDGIVKTPTILHLVDKADPTGITNKNAVEKYGDWITAGVRRLRVHEQALSGIRGVKPVMFLMCENVAHADAIGNWLTDKSSGFRLKEDEVLVIHTDRTGEVKKSELDELRAQARKIDDPSSPVKVVVSVLVLREGWDVRNVSVVLGLRPGTAEARILPEQAVGRGLRLMRQLGPDQRQVLEVMGTPAFEAFVRELEGEGVAIGTTTKPPKPGVKITPVRDKRKHDIAIPRTGPILRRSYRRIDDFDPMSAPPCVDADDIARLRALRLKVQEATHGVDLGAVTVERRRPLLPEEIVAVIARKAQEAARLTGEFASLVPKVRIYLAERCFDEAVDLDDEPVRMFLSEPTRQERVAAHLGRLLGELTVESRPLSVEAQPIRLSETDTFLWRRETTEATKTVFNFVATYNSFETAFAEFLEHAKDVKSFAALAEHFTIFGVEYLKPSGALGRYYPDYVVVEKVGAALRYWIAETKGRVWDGTDAKDAAIRHWCEQVTALAGEPWSYMRVDQGWWNQHHFATFAALVGAMEERDRALPEAVLIRAPEAEEDPR